MIQKYTINKILVQENKNNYLLIYWMVMKKMQVENSNNRASFCILLLEGTYQLKENQFTSNWAIARYMPKFTHIEVAITWIL